jgi:hypothetical protein
VALYSGFPTKTWYALFHFPVCRTCCPSSSLVPKLITQIILGNEYELYYWQTSLPVTNEKHTSVKLLVIHYFFTGVSAKIRFNPMLYTRANRGLSATRSNVMQILTLLAPSSPSDNRVCNACLATWALAFSDTMSSVFAQPTARGGILGRDLRICTHAKDISHLNLT